MLWKDENDMRKLFISLRIVVVIACLWFAGMLPAGATDIWVDHWASENIDVYIMDDTLSYGTTSNSKRFKISTKMVQNGHLKEVVTWNFSKYKSDMWRYQTNTMDRSHDTAACPRNRVFEYGMNQIGWSYHIRDYWYY